MDSYSHETGSFSGKGGIEIFFQKWIADKAKAIVLVVHSLGEHSGRYENLIKSLANKNISVMAMDLRGHGRSEGARGHIDSFMDYIYDLKLFVEYIKSEYNNLPITVYGHGVGGVISTKYAVTYSGDVSGLVLSSPAFAPINTLSGLKKGIVSFFSPRIPTLSMSSWIDANSLSRDEETVKTYKDDKLTHGKVTVRWITEYMSAGSDCLKSSHLVKCPTLVFQGKADTVADYTITEKFYEGIKVEKELLLYDNLYHETINEPLGEREKVLSEIVRWVASKASSLKGAIKNVTPKGTSLKKASAKKAVSKKEIAKKPAAKKSTAKKTTEKKTAVKKSASKKTSAKKAVSKKETTKKPASKKSASKKTTAKKTKTKK